MKTNLNKLLLKGGLSMWDEREGRVVSIELEEPITFEAGNIRWERVEYIRLKGCKRNVKGVPEKKGRLFTIKKGHLPTPNAKNEEIEEGEDFPLSEVSKFDKATKSLWIEKKVLFTECEKSEAEKEAERRARENLQQTNEQQKEENQRTIVSAILNNFSLYINENKQVDFEVESDKPQIPTGSDYIKSWGGIFQVIKSYIRSHPEQFKLGRMIYRIWTGPGKRPWWSEVILPQPGHQEPWQDTEISGNPPHMKFLAKTRVIEHKGGIGGFIHPNALSQDEYEELKNLISDVCRVQNCCNNFHDPGYLNRYNVGSDGICLYHHSQQNGGTRAFNNFTDAEERQFNSRIDELWRKISQNIDKYRQFDAGKMTEIEGLMFAYEGNGKNLEKNLARELITNMEGIVQRIDAQGNNNNNNNNNPRQDQTTIQEFKKEVIELITKSLSHSQISDNDLSPENRDWKSRINKSNDKQEIENIKEWVLAEIRVKKSEELNNKQLEKLVQEAEALVKSKNYEELHEKLQQIVKFRGQKIYDSLKSKIDALEASLEKLNPEKYRDDAKNDIENELAKNDLKKDNLSSENRTKLDNLKNSSNIKKDKENILNEIVQQSVINELDKLLDEFEKATSKKSKEEIKNKLRNFVALIHSNKFKKNAFEKRKDKLEKILGMTEKGNKQLDNSSRIPFIIITISLLSIVVFGIVLVLTRNSRINKKSKQRKKIK